MGVTGRCLNKIKILRRPCVHSRGNGRVFWSVYLSKRFLCQMRILDTRISDLELSNRYTMGCPPVRRDNPRALASGLSYVQVDKHFIPPTSV